MGRMPKIGLAFLLSACCLAPGLRPAGAAETDADQAPNWNTLADCAAGYLANWQDRQSSPDRTKEMGDMIHAQSDQYKAAATKTYETQSGLSEAESVQFVDTYVQDQLPRFVTMDKAGKLETFIDECPQADDSDQD
jgi:hypothetical protein